MKNIAESAQTFTIFPAIDLLDGRSVRLQQGRRESAHTVHPDPLAQLRGYAACGAKWVHVVDLNAAFGDPLAGEARAANRAILKRVLLEGTLNVQAGGGVRGEADALALFELGVQRVVVGTWAVKAPEAVMALARRFPGRVVVGLDTVGGYVAVQGWTESSAHSVEDFGRTLRAGGVDTSLFTEVERDGLLSGIDAERAGKLAADTGLSIIASGGARDLGDITRLADTRGVSGVVVGKALHAGTLRLEEALAFQRD